MSGSKVYFPFCPFLLGWLHIQVTETLNLNYLSWIAFISDSFRTFHIRFQKNSNEIDFVFHVKCIPTFPFVQTSLLKYFSWSRILYLPLALICFQELLRFHRNDIKIYFTKCLNINNSHPYNISLLIKPTKFSKNTSTIGISALSWIYSEVPWFNLFVGSTQYHNGIHLLAEDNWSFSSLYNNAWANCFNSSE